MEIVRFGHRTLLVSLLPLVVAAQIPAAQAQGRGAAGGRIMLNPADVQAFPEPPEGINADECEAKFNEGVLEVSLPAPKQEARKTRQIQIR